MLALEEKAFRKELEGVALEKTIAATLQEFSHNTALSLQR